MVGCRHRAEYSGVYRKLFQNGIMHDAFAPKKLMYIETAQSCPIEKITRQKP